MDKATREDRRCEAAGRCGRVENKRPPKRSSRVRILTDRGVAGKPGGHGSKGKTLQVQSDNSKSAVEQGRLSRVNFYTADTKGNIESRRAGEAMISGSFAAYYTR
jgi:hypothetical protein